MPLHPKKPSFFPDPMEAKVAELLDLLGLVYVGPEDGPVLGHTLDFRVGDVGIEAKQHHSDRAIRQLSNFRDAILFQGLGAVEMMIAAVRRLRNGAELAQGAAARAAAAEEIGKPAATRRFRDPTMATVYRQCRDSGRDTGSIFYFQGRTPRAGGSIRSAYWAGRSGSGGDLYKQKDAPAYAAWAAGHDDRQLDLAQGNPCPAPEIRGNGGKTIYRDWVPKLAAEPEATPSFGGVRPG